MNCAHCGEALTATAKFCKKCGTHVVAEPEAPKRGMPTAPVPAYTTCPDCGAVCKPDALFCVKCGCRFESPTGFSDTRRDGDAPERGDRAVMVFGNVQDSSESVDTGKDSKAAAPVVVTTADATVVTAGVAAIDTSVPLASAAPARAAGDSAKRKEQSDWLINDKPPRGDRAEPKPAAAPSARPSTGPSTGPSAGPAAPTKSAKSARTPTPAAASPAPLNIEPAGSSSTPVIVLGVLALALAGGGATWWWATKVKAQKPAASVVTAPAVPAASAAPAVSLPAESVLTSNESIEPPAVPGANPAVLVTPAVVDPAPAAVPADTETSARATEAARPAPAARKPARKQSLDDLLN